MLKRMTLMMTLLALAGLAHAEHDRGYDRGYGGGYGGYEAVARAAHAMENASRHFYRQLRHERRRGHATGDARRLVKAAERFHRRVERGASPHKVERAWNGLLLAFDDARYAYRRHAGHGQSRHDYRHGYRDDHYRGRDADFYPVARTFRNLERTLYAEARRSRGHERYGHHDRGNEFHAGLALLTLLLDR